MGSVTTVITMFLDVKRFEELCSILQHVQDALGNYIYVKTEIMETEDSESKFIYFKFRDMYFACRLANLYKPSIAGAMNRKQ